MYLSFYASVILNLFVLQNLYLSPLLCVSFLVMFSFVVCFTLLAASLQHACRETDGNQ